MPPSAEAGERLVCVILAAQAAEVRDRIDGGETLDLLWRTTDVLSQMSGMVLELMQQLPTRDSELDDRCAAAVTAGVDAGRSLDQLAFVHAQRQDFSRQLAECVVIALGRLAAADVPIDARLTPDDLAALYVCEDQREVHDTATRQFAIDELWGAQGPGSEERASGGTRQMTIASSASGLWRGLTSWATIFPAVASGACGLAIVASADAPVLARLLGAAVAGFGLFAAVVTRRRQASGPRVDSTIIEKVVLFAPVVEFDSGPMDEAPQEMVVERSEPPVAPIQDLQPAIWPVGSAIADEVDTSVTTVLGENQQLRDMAREMVTASDQAKEQFKVASLRSAEAESGMAELRAFNSELTESVQVIGAEVQRSIGIVEVTTSQAAAARACVETMATLSGAVSEVTQMIGDIARQSRMLAVNARIEAALAGDAGKGFVVVAREMGQLASQTADATEVIRQKTVQITSTVAETVESLEALVATIASVDTSSASIGRAIADQTGLAERVSSSLVDVHDAVAILSREIREAAQVAANGGMLAGLMVDATDSVDGLMVGLKGKLKGKGKGKLGDMGAGLGPTAADPELGAQELAPADGQKLAA